MTKPFLKKVGKIAFYGACVAGTFIEGAYAVGELETKVNTVTATLVGTMFTGILAAAVGYRSLPLLKEYQFEKLGTLILMAAIIVFTVMSIYSGSAQNWFFDKQAQ